MYVVFLLVFKGFVTGQCRHFLNLSDCSTCSNPEIYSRSHYIHINDDYLSHFDSSNSHKYNIDIEVFGRKSCFI